MASQKDLKEIKQSVSLLHYVANQGVKFERRGEEYWACCPLPGHKDATPSFAIKLKAGEEVFFCQGCSKGGDVIRYIEITEGMSAKDAIAKLKSLSLAPVNNDLGVKKSTFSENAAVADDTARVAGAFQNISDVKPKETKPMSWWLQFENALLKSREVIKWLEAERGLDLETAQRLHFGYQQSTKGRLPPEFENARHNGWVMFPRVDGDKVVAIKMRSISVKAFIQVPNMDPKALFNMDAASALEDLFVTEGEIDSATFEMCDFRATSIPNASSKLTPENKIVMKRASRVFLAGDNDGGVGNAAMKALRAELGSNVYLIEWPGAKDANEFFIKVCKRSKEVFKQRITELVSRALSQPADGFISLPERVRRAAEGSGTDIAGDPTRLHLPFNRLDNMSYVSRGSVVTFYSTYSGTGKTVFITQAMLKEAERGETIVVYSPEITDERYLGLVAAQILGPGRLPAGLDRAGKITPADYKELGEVLALPCEKGSPINYYVGHLLPLREGETVPEFLEKIIVATGCTRFVIDTFPWIVKSAGRENTVDAEGRAMREIRALAEKHKMIFIIIGQSNKEAEDLKEARKDAHGVLRGNREITDLSAAVYLIHRKRSPETSAAGGPVDLLEKETSVILVKGSIQGPTGKFCSLTYKKECSRFYEVSLPPQQNEASGQPQLSANSDSPMEPF